MLGKSSLEQQQSWMEPEPRGRLQLWGQSRAAGAGFCPGTAVFGTRSEPSTYLPQGCFDSVEPLPQPGDRNSPGQLHNLISFGPVLRTKDRFLYKPVEGGSLICISLCLSPAEVSAQCFCCKKNDSRIRLVTNWEHFHFSFCPQVKYSSWFMLISCCPAVRKERDSFQHVTSMTDYLNQWHHL